MINSLVFFVLLLGIPALLIWKSSGKNYSDISTNQESDSHILQVQVVAPDDGGTQWNTEIFFADDDPRDWDDYKGQERLKEFVQLQLDVLPIDRGLKLIFASPKGGGKTTLFRIIGNKLITKRGGRYVEITPSILSSKKKLDELMEQLQENDVLCLDEVHMLPRTMADTLLPAIEDGIYPFASGMKRIATGISWIAATTDVGLLPEAFRDRFQILALEPLSQQALIEILIHRSFPITLEAATEIAHRSVGSPRELKRIFALAEDVAVQRRADYIDQEDTENAFRLLDLDHNGLYPNDRRVLNALYSNPKLYARKATGEVPKRYAHSERAIRALTGLDETLYRDEVEPKLLKLSFLTIGTAGRELTEKSFTHYFPQDNG